MVAGRTTRGILAGLVTVLTVALVGLGVFAWDRVAGAQDRAVPVAPATVVPADGGPPGCPRAQPTLFSGLAAHLARRDDRFSPRQFALDSDRLTYLSAPVGDADGRLRSAAPVWVYGGSGYAWLNDAARRESSGLPDGKVLYGADPAGGAATTVASCAQAAAAR